jgi:hypothetical protein
LQTTFSNETYREYPQVMLFEQYLNKRGWPSKEPWRRSVSSVGRWGCEKAHSEKKEDPSRGGLSEMLLEGTAIMLASYGLAQVGALRRNTNDTDCFCDGGGRFGFRGRFEDFASRADCAPWRCCRFRSGDAGVFAATPSGAISSGASLLVAQRSSRLQLESRLIKRARQVDKISPPAKREI